MSIKLMSAIFETDFRDLQDSEGNITKASTAKFVTLALADHANDEGEGAYPSIDLLARKTNLTRQCVINTLDALKYNGIAILVGESKRRTNNYTINKGAFPKADDGSKSRLLVIPVDYQQSTQITEIVNPVDPNHTITITKPSIGIDMPFDWKFAHGGEITEQDLHREKEKQMTDSANLLAMTFGQKARRAFDIAFEFMKARDIVIPETKIKGQRKAVKDMLDMNITAQHVRAAVEKLINDGMTVVDLFSVSNTAYALANPTPEQKGTNPQGLDIGF